MNKKVNCILLVDDNPHDSYFNTIIIKEANICNYFRNVNDGEEALEYLLNSGKNHQDPKPNLIFLDINMPRMNGFEFLREFEKLDGSIRENIVIIMLSTSDIPSDREKTMKTKEVKEFITKPLNFELLDEIVERYF